MTKVNGNGGDKSNLEAIKAYYEALNTTKTGKQEKTQEAKPVVSFKTEQIEASALDATAAQIWGVHLTNVDKSEVATAKRMELAFETAPFMTTLAELQGIEPDFRSFAMANIQGVDHDKLNRHMQQPLNPETEEGIGPYLDTMIL